MLDSTDARLSAEQITELEETAGKILNRVLYDGASPDLLANFFQRTGFDPRVAGMVRIALQGASNLLAERNKYLAALPCNYRVFKAHIREKFARAPSREKIARMLGVRPSQVRKAEHYNEVPRDWYTRLNDVPDVPPAPPRPPKQPKQGGDGQAGGGHPGVGLPPFVVTAPAGEQGA